MKWRLTTKIVDDIRPSTLPCTYWDTELIGFGVHVDHIGRKLYIVKEGLDPSRSRVIGQHPDNTAERIRLKAFSLLADKVFAKMPQEDTLSIGVGTLNNMPGATFLPLRDHEELHAPAGITIMACTRVGIDDFNMLRIWHAHIKSFVSEIAVVIFRRPADDITEIVQYCERSRFYYTIVNGIEFRNKLTLDALKSVVHQKRCSLIYHSDTDEFISGSQLAFATDCSAALSGQAVLMKMRDRLSQFRKLYDIGLCYTYADLCNVAPCVGNLTGALQGWATTKVSLQPWPLVMGLHSADAGSEAIGECWLDHFKWRKEWRAKAIRRLAETRNQRKPWSQGISNVLEFFEDDCVDPT